MIRGLLVVGFIVTLLLIVWTQKDQAGSAGIDGQWLYALHCAECHEKSHPELHKQPPNLHGLFLAKSLPSGAPATEVQVRKTIIEGRGTMPAFDRRLREEEVKGIVAYLRKLK